MGLTPAQLAELDRSAGNAVSPPRAACHAPFTTLSFQTSGDVFSCSRKPATYLGNVTRDNLKEIWHGRDLAALRESLRRYEFPVGCAWCGWCARQNQLGAADLRKYSHLAMGDAGVEEEWPRRFEFNLTARSTTIRSRASSTRCRSASRSRSTERRKPRSSDCAGTRVMTSCG